ncbi:MAG: hypothetical protein IAE78_28975 [Myxococcus sp.]|nr:hypothetical protein [Myxococcus sp.]
MRARLLLIPAVVLLGCGRDAGPGPEEPPARETAQATATEDEPVQVVHTGPETPSRPPGGPARFVLRLEARSGDSAVGFSLASLSPTPFADADLYLNAWDCGARGRWIELRSAKVAFCSQPRADTVDAIAPDDEGCSWTSAFEAGGTTGGSFETFVGVSALVRRGDQRLGRLRVARATVLESTWYAVSPIAPYEVELEFLAEPR